MDVQEKAQLQSLKKETVTEMIEKFKDLGINIQFDELLKVVGNGSIGRPHFAKILKDKGIVNSQQEAFQQYLRKEGPAYVNKINFVALRKHIL